MGAKAGERGERRRLGRIFVRENDSWVRALAVPRMLDGRGFGNLCKLRDQGIYGREIPLATIVGRRRHRAGEVAEEKALIWSGGL